MVIETFYYYQDIYLTKVAVICYMGGMFQVSGTDWFHRGEDAPDSLRHKHYPQESALDDCMDAWELGEQNSAPSGPTWFFLSAAPPKMLPGTLEAHGGGMGGKHKKIIAELH